MRYVDFFRGLERSSRLTAGTLLVEFRDIQPSIERDIFQRVQMGVTLTTAGMRLLSILSFHELTIDQRNSRRSLRRTQIGSLKWMRNISARKMG